jgi:hypothetical protein
MAALECTGGAPRFQGLPEKWSRTESQRSQARVRISGDNRADLGSKVRTMHRLIPLNAGPLMAVGTGSTGFLTASLENLAGSCSR